MIEKDLYNKYFVDNNIIYSLDMIRLKTYIDYNTFAEIEFRFSTCWKKYLKKNYNSSKMQDFFYNYVVEVEEGKSFWFGFLHNQEKRQGDIMTSRGNVINSTYNFTIEFNPNKLKDNNILMYLLSISGDWYLKSYDIAFDIKINILDLITDMSGKSFERVDSRGYDNKTIYIGKGDGRVKVYNKKKESNLDILGYLTRIEVSRDGNDFEIRKVKVLNYDYNFPWIYTNNYIYSLSDYQDKTTLGLLYAVQNGYPLRNLTYSYRKKIKSMLEGGYMIKFSNKVATNILRQTILYYFINNDKVVFW